MKKDLLEMSQIMILAIREDVKNNRGNAINWENISHVYNLSEDFIKEFELYIPINLICVHQKLSEDYIRKLFEINKVNWAFISRYQKLSKEFIIEFIHKIHFNFLLHNDNIPQEVKDYCRMFL